MPSISYDLRVNITDRDVDEFRALSAGLGVELSHDNAREAATRLLLVYQTIARPTPSELRAARLAKSVTTGIVSSESTREMPIPIP
jgi:hypothetical protein